MSAKARSLVDLPLEILLRIIEYAPATSLAALRGSCSHLKYLVDPKLWHTIYLYPHMDHLSQAIRIYTSPSISQYVRRVFYDLQWTQVLDRILQRIKSVWSIRNTLEQKSDALARATALKRKAIEPGPDVDIELLLLRDMLLQFPSLESITVLEQTVGCCPEPVSDLDLLPAFYRRAINVVLGPLKDSNLEPDIACRYAVKQCVSASPRKLLLAALSFVSNLKHFEVRTSLWHHILSFELGRKHMSLWGMQIRGLKSLTLHGSFLGPPRTTHLLIKLSIFLDNAVSLEDLDLAFNVHEGTDLFDEDLSDDEDEDDEDDDDLYSLDRYKHSLLQPLNFQGVRSTRLGKGLKRLALSHMRCRSSEIMTLLKRAAPTLKALEFNYLHLIRERTPLGISHRKPCLVRLLGDIRSTVNLDSIYLSSTFRASKFQRYHLSPRVMGSWPHDREPCLLQRVMDWTLRVGPCPFEELAIHDDENDLTSEQMDRFREIDDESFHVSRNPNDYWGSMSPFHSENFTESDEDHMYMLDDGWSDEEDSELDGSWGDGEQFLDMPNMPASTTFPDQWAGFPDD